MQLNLKPASARIREYYSAINQFGQLNISHETAVRQAFASLLDTCAKQFKWKLVQEVRLPAPKNKSVIVDGALLDAFNLRRGYWEAKDSKDDLEKEIKKKLELGYPRNNIIFQSPERAVLYQQGIRKGLNEDITDANNLVELLKEFFQYREPQHEEWESAVADFSSRIPEIAGAVKTIIEKEQRTNKRFVASFEAFVMLCRQAINPNLSEEAVETMLIQHLLTERIFRKVFNNPEFTRRNIIAAEIEKVIDSLTSKHFNRDAFLRDLDRFYHAIEINAENATDFAEKQTFLNTVYERFFQGFSPKEADTHGIVYTPQPIVNFMVRSVEEILKKEFGKSLGDKEVHILDPFVGTGNFIVRIMQEIPKTRLQFKYDHELHCNEVMLLPYYIASMNIEHAYLEATGEYKAFEGICLVDTFELAEARQMPMFTAKNTERVQRQKEAQIFVVIGNPPYNVGQESESDNNKNRKYEVLDKRVRLTYAKSSSATNKNALNDPYVKALRWATDRIEEEEGIVAFVTNNSFVHGVSFDGVRKELAREFSEILHINLKGDARTTAERRRQEAGNVFDDEIKVSVGITLFIRKKGVAGCKIRLYDVEDYLQSEAKRSLLNEFGTMDGTPLKTAFVSSDNFWVLERPDEGFSGFISIGSKKQKASESPQSIFGTYGAGVATSRDAWAYNSDRASLRSNIKKTIAFYNGERNRWISSKNSAADVDDFVRYENAAISWSRDLKQDLVRNREAIFSEYKIRVAQYRPFQKQFLYFDRLFNEEVYVFPQIFPTAESESVNSVICLNDIAARSPLGVLIARTICDLHVCSSDRFQCFPFYIYAEDGSNRRENITDWALGEFRSHYKDKSITKWDIFYYTYAVLHHPEYRTRYATNLKRELPRIPYAPDFYAFAEAGKRLAELHVDYEKQKEYPLDRTEKPGEKLNLRVEKMRLSKDKQTLVYNDFLTLTGIPTETYEYRLGNRSALEWVIDQYQVSTDKRSGITNDPNRDDDKEYILRLIAQVITVSLETVKIVNALPVLGLPKEEKKPN